MIQLFKHWVAPEAAIAVAETLRSDCIGQGKKVDEFEAALEPWIGKNVTVNSGTSAMWLSYDLAGILPGDNVIASPMTCLLGLVPLAHMGANILWADVNPATGLIDPASVKKLLKKHSRPVRAITCVDYAGVVCDLEALMDLGEDDGIPVIVDAAHSFGANDGNQADLTAYSFQAIKHLTTGDGGAIAINNPSIRNLAVLKRWCGLDRTTGGFRCDQTVTLKGYKYHMTDIAASIGLANLPYVQRNIDLHRKHAKLYNEAGLGNMPLDSSCWMYNCMVTDREAFVIRMADRGVQVARTHNRCDRHPIFKSEARDLPGVTLFNDHQCSIPTGWWLSDEDVQTVIEAVLECR